ncbi:MAG TPA: dethiobiotin synthase [Solirubrobacteraceae bacterium]
MRGLFVTATDTGVGKSVLSAALVAGMRAEGLAAVPYKPVLTGVDTPSAEGSWPPDDELLALAAGIEQTSVAPLRFGPAVSPHLAADLAGSAIDPEGLLAAARHLTPAGETLIVEGVGGLLVPLSGSYLVRDLAAALALPVLIAARPGLGTINHTLLTLQAVREAGLDVRAVVLTPWPADPDEMQCSNRHTIAELGAVEVATLPVIESPGLPQLAAAGAMLPWRRWLAPPD